MIDLCNELSNRGMVTPPISSDDGEQEYEFPGPAFAEIGSQEFASLIKDYYSNPLPETQLMFPWLHGITESNLEQRAYYSPKRSRMSRGEDVGTFTAEDIPTPPPPPQISGLLLVVALDESDKKVIGAITPQDILVKNPDKDGEFIGEFIDSDPTTGHSSRGLDIQVSKWSQISTIVVYTTNESRRDQLIHISELVAAAQKKAQSQTTTLDRVKTRFVISQPPHHSDIGSDCTTSLGMFMEKETRAMRVTTKQRHLVDNIYLGNEDDNREFSTTLPAPSEEVCFVECKSVPVPTISTMDQIIRAAQKNVNTPRKFVIPARPVLVDPYLYVNVCKYIYLMNKHGKSILIYSKHHQPFGTSMLAVSYLMYSKGISLRDACARLCIPRKILTRNKELLHHLQYYIPRYSPAHEGSDFGKVFGAEWAEDKLHLTKSLDPIPQHMPSKIFDNVYLGSIEDANDHDILSALGITRILSIGEKIKPPTYVEHLEIEDVLDDGVDSLAPHISRCMEFLSNSPSAGKTLVHCQKGTSRSAIICMMFTSLKYNMTALDAYMHVRVRRSDFIVQPNLRFLYELWKFSESIGRQRSIDFPIFCHYTDQLNKKYMSMP